MAKPWERQENETDKSFHAFCMYRDMGPSRTIAKVAFELGHKGKKVVTDWSSKFNWVQRVGVYDSEQDRLKTEAQLKAKADSAYESERRHLRDTKNLQAMGMKILHEAFENRTKRVIYPKVALQMFETGIKNERLIKGQSTENVSNVSNEGIPVELENLTDDELRELHRLLTKANEFGNGREGDGKKGKQKSSRR